MDKELLFKPRLPEADVDVPGVGTVRVRGLNREEAKSLRKMQDVALQDLHSIAMGMVDPRMSVSEVRQWAEASPAGEMEVVSEKIAELSGMLDDAAKVAYKSVRDDAGIGVRLLPSPEVEDDGSGATGADEL